MTENSITDEDSTLGFSKHSSQNEMVNIKGLLYGLSAALFQSFSQPIFKMIFLKYIHISSFEINYWNGMIMLIANCIITKFLGAFVLDVPRKFH